MMKQDEEYKIKDAARTIEEYHKIAKDEKLMKKVEKHLKEKKKDVVKSIADIKMAYSEKMKEEEEEE